MTQENKYDLIVNLKHVLYVSERQSKNKLGNIVTRRIVSFLNGDIFEFNDEEHEAFKRVQLDFYRYVMNSR